MIKKVIAATFAMLLLPAAASAQTCNAVPNTLTNGTTADASQVMANFNAIVACIGGLRGYIGGLTMSNDATNPNTVIDTSSGLADSDDSTTMMTLTQAFTKNANAAWSSGTGNGCLDSNSGSALVANKWYHLFLIENVSSNTVDELCSSYSATSPALPSGYTKKRRIGSFKTNASSQIMAFFQNGDQFLWLTPVNDVSTTTLGTTPTIYPLSVPPGVQVTALFRTVVTAAAEGEVLINSPSEAPTASDVPIANQTAFWAAGSYNTSQASDLTDTNSNVRAVSTAANTTLYITTYGWIDTRGRFN